MAAGPDLAAEGRMRTLPLCGLALGLVIGMASVRGVEPSAAKGLLAGLKVGRPVTLKDLGSVYEVRLMDEPLPTGEEVAEVGEGYLVVRSVAGVETRVPVTSIKAVIVVTTE